MPAALLGSSLLSGLFGGNKQKTQNIPRFNPQQNQYLQGLYQGQGIESNPTYQQGNSLLQGLLSNAPGAYENFERPYYENFEQNILPTIAERFAGGLGEGGTGAGGLKSSAFGGQLAQAGRGLQTDLANMRSGMQLQTLPQALQYAQQPQQNQLSGLGASPYNQVFSPQGDNPINSLLQALQQALSQNGGRLPSFNFGGQAQAAIPNNFVGAR